MDVETAKALQSMVSMIDNVNDRSMLNGLSLDITVLLASALRKQGLLDGGVTKQIDAAFKTSTDDWPEGRAEKARAVLDVSQKLWEASTPS